MTLAINNLNLQYGTKCLLQDIVDDCIAGKGCYAQNRYFANKYGISISGVSKAIARLVKCGLIELDNSNTSWNVGRVIKLTDIFKKSLNISNKIQSK